MSVQKVIITGANGMLAYALKETIGSNFDLIALTEKELDITNSEDVLYTMRDIRPDVLVNAAAYTYVDKAEQEQTLARLINGTAVGYIAKACNITNTRVIHISSDYIFDGEKEGHYTEYDEPNPMSIYGISKLIGEQELTKHTDNYVIIRSQWLYGDHGSNFAETIISLAEKKDELKVVDDQYGSPTYTMDLAKAIKLIIQRNDIKKDIFNFSNEGVVSWFGFAKDIFRLMGVEIKLIPVDSSAYPRPAKRPHNSALDKTKIKNALGLDIRPWYDALYEYMKKTGRI
ncbi:MAG: dTDP-4-dehydrorhamnose reductase [Deltaproteobacteria bacterium]|nr:dTDP-4-dehydrorhamnose reductase [Deltaproteobacteria bacterium]MCL5792598.1 dTDP-4-dehydrorhamnose reductase [Deltaproteobacteria bacterium]